MTSAEFLQRLIETNLAAAAAILAVIVFRRPARRLIGPGAAYALWLAVPIAALAVLVPSPWKQIVEAAAVSVAPAFVETGPALTAAPVATFDPEIWIIAGWALGAILMLGLFAFAQRAFAGIGRPQAASVSGPAVVGALFPRVVLPADFETRYTPPEQELILAHEQAHLRAGHAQINGLVALAQCLAWFNPLIHLGARLMRIDQELACDAAVLARNPETRRLYAETLLKTQTTNRPLPFGCYWPADGVGPLKERIQMMKRPSPTFARRIYGAAAASGMVLATGLTAWAAQPARVEFVSPPEAAVALPYEAREFVDASVVPQDSELLLKVGMRIGDEQRLFDAVPIRTGDRFKVDFNEDGSIFLFVSALADSDPIALRTALVADGELIARSEPAVPNKNISRVETRANIKGQNGVEIAYDIQPILNRVNFEAPADTAEPARPLPATQTPPQRPSVITAPDWIERPTGADFAAAYPERLRQDGAALVACTATAQGRLAGCSVVAERPAGYGVGEAALALAAKMRMRPQTRDGAPVEGARVNVPFQFTLQAEQAPARYITRPSWTRQPNSDQWARLFDLVGDGQAEMVLDCQITRGGELTGCAVPAVRPEGRGLETALLEMATYYRMETSRADGTSVVGDRVRLPFVFDMRANRAPDDVTHIPDDSPLDLSEDDFANMRLVIAPSNQRPSSSRANPYRAPLQPSDIPPEIMLDPDA